MGLEVEDGFRKMANYEEFFYFRKLEDWFVPTNGEVRRRNLKVRLYVLKALL